MHRAISMQGTAGQLSVRPGCYNDDSPPAPPGQITMESKAVVDPRPSFSETAVAAPDEECVRVRQRLSSAVARICPSWLAGHAEDIVQTALMRVLPILAQRASVDPLPSSYLWKAAYSATIDEIRRRRHEFGLALDAGTAEDIPDRREADPERKRWGREIGSAIRQCLARMVRQRRLAVTLHLLGHSLAEASHLLGWDVKRVDNLVYRGLADLRGCLSSKGLVP